MTDSCSTNRIKIESAILTGMKVREVALWFQHSKTSSQLLIHRYMSRKTHTVAGLMRLLSQVAQLLAVLA